MFCNSISYCGHSTHSRFLPGVLTYTQVGLRWVSIRPVPTLLPQNHWVILWQEWSNPRHKQAHHKDEKKKKKKCVADLRIVFRFESYDNFLGLKFFGSVFMFKIHSDLNSCDFLFLIFIYLVFFLKKKLYANVAILNVKLYFLLLF